MLVGGQRMKHAFGLTVPEILLHNAPDDIGHMPQLAISLHEKLRVHVPQQVIVLSFIAGGAHKETGDAVEVLQA